MALENAAALKLVARLVMEYLDDQNLTDAYNAFCETSRHISDEEYEAYSQGIKSLDTGLCLINIVKEYFYVKDKFRDFIKTCPKTAIINSLIDTTSVQCRLDIILKVLKDNLLKIDKVQEEVSRKRRKTENELFDVSQTNTSTPETIHPLKKRKLGTPLNNLLSEETEQKEVNVVISSPETSNKEDDVTDEESENKKITAPKIAPPPELLSETLLNKPDFAENLAEIINKTLAEREESHEKVAEATSSQNLLTQYDVQDILSKTEDKSNFEDILKEVIDKYLIDGPENGNQEEFTVLTPKSSTTSIKEGKNEEIPIKQRLRPRTARKAPPSEKKPKKINIISNELYTGPLPLCMNLPADPPTTTTTVQQIETHSSQPLVLVPIVPTTTTFIPLQSFHTSGNIICESNIQPMTNATEIPSNLQIILTENNPSLPNLLQTSNTNVIDKKSESEEQKEVTEKTQKTPKTTIQASFLESKCKSTPRRKASHVRILDFNAHQTPSGRLSTIKECLKTPSNSIRMDTPGSAPSIMVSQKTVHNKVSTVEKETIEIADDSSNSNSISNTPKVAKNRRRRKIEIDSKLDKTHEEVLEEPKPMTQEEWMRMREEQKSMSVDDRMRFLFQQNEEKTNPKRRKTPKKRRSNDHMYNGDGKIKKKLKPTSTNIQLVKSKLCAKFKVTSPRKSALLRKTPKKKKSLVVTNLPAVESKSEPVKQTKEIETTEEPTQVQHPNLPKLTSPVASTSDSKKDESNSSDQNRSDTVQEVAKLLTHLPETILAKTNSATSLEQIPPKSATVDTAIFLETPLKTDSISPLPNTPRFAVPLISTHQETPVAKDVIAITTAPSIQKFCDIFTPSFPITPGFKVTPDKIEPSPGGYSSRKTDYSSCSSYYKPDESEDINQNFDNMIKQSRADRSSQSESDGGTLAIIAQEKKEKVRAGTTKKVECPGALDRVLSFTEDTNAVMMPHYNMNEEGLLSESLLTTATDESSSSFTCSTCSTDPSSDEDTMVKLCKATVEEKDDKDSEWHCDEEIDFEKSNNSLVDEKTGEVRFPLRNWITPKKIEQEPAKIIAQEVKVEKVLTTICTETVMSIEEQKKEEHKQRLANMEAIKQRTLKILKKESATVAKKAPSSLPKIKKANVKQFKLPAEQPKTLALTRRDQILQHNLTERPKSTPLKLIPSTSSSRRKCLTPRKTIIMDELPKADPSVKKPSKKRQSSEKTKPDNSKQQPVVPEKVSIENINDNAVMMHHDEHPSLNISTSFHDTSDDEPENTVVDRKKTQDKSPEEGSNTFQKTLIAQGFAKAEAKDLQEKFVDKIEEPRQTEEEVVKKVEIIAPKPEKIEAPDHTENESEDDEEDECELILSDALEKNVFSFSEPSDFVPKEVREQNLKLCAPAKLQIDGKIVKIDFSDTTDIFSMEPTKMEAANCKEEPKDVKPSEQQKILPKEITIDKILTMIHGKH